MFLRAAVFSLGMMLSVSEAWLMSPQLRTSLTARQFGASGAQDDSYSDLAPEILGSPQWLENLTKTHRTGYYPASWSTTLKPETPSSLSRQYTTSTNQYYNEPGSMLSRKSVLSSPIPGRPSWSNPSDNLSPKEPLSSFSSLPSNSNVMHPDVATKIRIQYCPTSAGESVPPCTPPPETIAPTLTSHQKEPMTPSTAETDTRLTSAKTLTDKPILEPDTVSAATTLTTTTAATILDLPLPYPEHKMMSFLDGGQHILHGNIAEFAEEKSQRNLKVVQAKKELFPQESISTSDEADMVEKEMNPTEPKDDALKKKERMEAELARWEEASKRDALRRAKKNETTFVHQPEDEDIDLNGLEWIDDDTPPDAENVA